MHTYLIEMLECPACHGELDWRITKQVDDRIESAQANCSACATDYPIRDEIGIFLLPDLPRNDLWEQVDSELLQYLHAHPDIERRLMEPPLDTLTPADQFFRAVVLEEHGNYTEARIAEELADAGLYIPQYLGCREKQMNYVIQQLTGAGDPIVDLATGRGYLIEKFIHRLKSPVVATDFSPRVLRRDRLWLQHFGLYDRVSLLAFDARRTPFKNGAIKTLTTNLGLPNIEEPGNLLKELRRIVEGTFLAISHFYPEDDEANAKVIRETGLDSLLYRRTALECFAEAGWQVEVANSCVGEARPTPVGAVLEGARIDGLPVRNTELEWCVMIGTT